MIRFAIFVALFFLLICLCVYYKDKLGNKLFVMVVSILAIIFVGGFIYTALDNKDGEIKQDIIESYKKGEILDCDGIEVSKKTHGFDNGTSVFVDNKSYKKINMFVCVSKGEL